MAEVSTVARPYAKAAFEYAQEKDLLTQWSDMLAAASAVASNSDMSSVLDNPSLTSEQKAAIFVDVCGADLGSDAKNFVSGLAEHKRLAALPMIAEMFEELKAAKDQAVDVMVTSAFEMSAEQQNKLAETLKNKWQKDVSIETQVDSSLIGGVIIRAGDVVIDSSVRGKLAKVAEAVNS
jgi:F-type H+-transporting ATPase subunit delta